MGIKQVKVAVNEVIIGMFVSGLDKPWTQSPFPLQGFYVRTVDHIKQLKLHCQYVYVDVAKGAAPLHSNLRTLSERRRTISSPVGAELTNVRTTVAPLKICRHVYPPKAPLKKEIVKARALHLRVQKAVEEVIKTVGAGKSNVPLRETKRLASAMVDSVIRNPDAFSWLTRVRDKDEHTYSHSVRSAIWAILFGRSIGLPKLDLDILALAVLLKDVGKTQLPAQLLKLSERNKAEQETYEQFVKHSVAILRSIPDLHPRVILIVKTHCEKINGGGFPNRLRGDKIPLLGKIAGIVTFYDEITNPRGQRSPLSPSKAVAKLYEARDVDFQEELVVEFIRAIGLYPTGTLVQLSSGQVAVVVEQNMGRRLKPTVMVLADADRKPLEQPQVINLAAKDKRRQDLLDSGKISPGQLESLEIVQDMEPGTFDLDATAMCNLYLAKASGGSFISTLKTRLPNLFGG